MATPTDSSIAARIERVLSQMTLEEKLGQTHLAPNERDIDFEALKAGRPGAAGVDVYEAEPLPAAGHPLLTLPNVLCTHHIAWAEHETFELYFGNAELLRTELDRYLAVTAEDVRRVAGKYFAATNRTVLDVTTKAREPSKRTD